MKKGMIKIPIDEVWELVNKPHRFYSTLENEVDKLPCGEYEYLNFDQETKDEMVQRIHELGYGTGLSTTNKEEE